MPLYEYLCGGCGRDFEKLVRLAQANDVCCPGCGSRDVRKRLSTFGIGGGASRIKSSESGCATCSRTSCSTCK